MKHFRKIRTGIDTAPFLAEIAGLDDAWARATGRQDKIRVQREALAIPLRGLRRSALGERQRRDVQESRWTGVSRQLPHAREFLKRLAEELEGELGRAKFVCLPAGHRVYPHVDRGLYYLVRDRYHLVLHSPAGSYLRAGEESVRMAEGELWWFDNKQEHEAVNDGPDGRVHLIFDLWPSVVQPACEVGRELSEGAR